MKSDGLSENRFFEITAFANQISNGIAVIDTRNVLMDNRTFVKNRSGVMCGGSDEFNAALVGLMVRFAAREGRKKGVVDINDGATGFREEMLGKHLHVARQHEALDTRLFENAQLRRLRFGFVICRDGDVVEGNPVIPGLCFEALMVRKDATEFTRQFSRTKTEHGVVKTMINLGNKEGDLGAFMAQCHLDLHSKFILRESLEFGGFPFRVTGR